MLFEAHAHALVASAASPGERAFEVQLRLQFERIYPHCTLDSQSSFRNVRCLNQFATSVVKNTPAVPRLEWLVRGQTMSYRGLVTISFDDWKRVALLEAAANVNMTGKSWTRKRKGSGGFNDFARNASADIRSISSHDDKKDPYMLAYNLVDT